MPRWTQSPRWALRSQLAPRSLPKVVSCAIVPPAAAPPAGKNDQRIRARRSLLLGLTMFLVLQGALTAAIVCRCVPVRDLAFADKWEALVRLDLSLDAPDGPRPMRVLALGSSRTLFGFDPARFDLDQPSSLRTRSFNFGVAAAGPITQNLYLRRLLRQGVRPDAVLVEVLPAFLADQVETPMELQWLHPYRLHAGEAERVRAWYPHYPAPAECSLWREWLFPWHAHRSALLARQMPRWNTNPAHLDHRGLTDARGWAEPLEEASTPETLAEGLRWSWKQYAPYLSQFHLGGPGPQALRDLLQIGRDHAIPIALVWMPESSQFRRWYTPQALEQLQKFFDRLQVEFGCPMIDASEWVTDSGFADGHHLLRSGSRNFTDRLRRELSPWLSANRQQTVDR